MGTETDLSTGAVARLSSVFDRQVGRHRVPIELESGLFDFDREDRVGVEVQNRRGGWRRIGELDVKLSRPETAFIEMRGEGTVREGVIEAGQRLRFTSHFEVQSLRRRTDAVDRVLEGSGRLRDLLDVFDPRSMAQPRFIDHELDTQL